MQFKSKKEMNNFQQALWTNGFTDTSVKGNEKIAEYFDVTTRTVRRWIKDDRAPKRIMKQLALKNKHLTNDWNGFSLTNDKLKTPNGYEYSRNELETLAIKIKYLKILIN